MNLLNSLFPGISINTKLLVFFLMLMFVDYGGYGYYLFYFTFAYLFLHKAFRMIDTMYIFLFLWGMAYGVFNCLNFGVFGYGHLFVFIINCPVLYLAGKYIVSYNEKESFVFVLYLFVLSLAFISLLSVIKDISENGFYVIGAGRNIPLIGINNAEGYIAATGISSRLMLLASCFVFFLFPLEFAKKVVLVGCALIAIYCTVRIQSRTSIVCLIGVLCIIVVASWKMLSGKQKMLLYIGLLLILSAVVYLVGKYADELVVLERFQADEIESGGGRTYLLMNVISHMGEYPFGGMGSDIRYAHNLWFDCARVAGIFPFTLLVLITIIYVWFLYFIVMNRSLNIVLRLSLLVFSFTILVIFLSEPVLEGIPMVFEFFCFLLGMVTCLYKSERHGRVKLLV